VLVGAVLVGTVLGMFLLGGLTSGRGLTVLGSI
jgi:hypothetical protein